MRVLVACEESQTVCTAFRERGHEAYSCDILQPSGDHPEWHIWGNVIPILMGGYVVTMNMVGHEIGKWDLVIAHPPCTDLAVSGARWFPEKQRDFRQQKAVAFFMQMFTANAESIAVENPIGIMSKCYREPDQIIQPYDFGDPVRKATCLWLKNLNPLVPTNVVKPVIVRSKDGKSFSGPSFYATDGNGKILAWNDPRTAKARSKTYKGIAMAMAQQWGG